MRKCAVWIAVVCLGSLLWHGSLAGQQEPDWTATYSSSGRAVDHPFAIGVDESGRVWVTGSTNRGIVPPGKPDDVCSDDDICRDWITLMYSPEGDELWRMPYDGPGNSTDDAYALDVDSEGNAYVAGGASQPEGGHALTTIKYSEEGEELWVRAVTMPDRSFSRAWAVLAGEDGSIHVSGQGSGRTVIVKYSADGDTLWTAEHGSTTARKNQGAPQTLAVDYAGNVYVTAALLIREPEVVMGYLTIKYSPDGEEVWASQYISPGEAADPIALQVDGQGNVYVTGRFQVGNLFGGDFATVKYSPLGDELWAKTYSGPRWEWDAPEALAVDETGNAYVAGLSTGAEDIMEMAIIKYSPDGDELWVRRLAREGESFHHVLALSLRPDGPLLVAGSTANVCTIVSYSPEGGVLGEIEYAWPSGSFYPAGVVLESTGAAHVTGNRYSEHSGQDFITLQYSPLSGDFRRGDTNADGTVDIADPIGVLGVLFLGRGRIACADAADANDDGTLDITDAVTTLDFLFRGGPGIPDPGPRACGADPTPDDLGCAGSQHCP